MKVELAGHLGGPVGDEGLVATAGDFVGAGNAELDVLNRLRRHREHGDARHLG
jgi:hypothetical protein